MAGIKTAISIDEGLFEEIEQLASQLNFSRSKIFAIAAREFVERCKNKAILEKLNEVYQDESDEEKVLAKQMKKRLGSKAKNEPW
ncbi:MAG: CopG family transcriptional regulator [Candidatus Rifleibacteriota bacterium]